MYILGKFGDHYEQGVVRLYDWNVKRLRIKLCSGCCI